MMNLTVESNTSLFPQDEPHVILYDVIPPTFWQHPSVAQQFEEHIWGHCDTLTFAVSIPEEVAKVLQGAAAGGGGD